MKWMLTTGLFALYVLVAGCAGEVTAPDNAPDKATEGENALIGCCQSDYDCTARKLPRCVEGVCSEAPGPGECWDDSDCEKPGWTCEGEVTCPCGYQCLVPSHPGTCTPPADPCAGLDYCSCIANPYCQTVTEPCFCPFGQYKCAGNGACFCGGGAYLGCESQ